MTLKMRRATRDDLEDIVALLADDILGAGREVKGERLDESYETAFNAIDADPNQLLAIFEDDCLVGCLQLTFIPGLSRRGALRGQIEGVRIAAGRRGEGLGTKMFQWRSTNAADVAAGTYSSPPTSLESTPIGSMSVLALSPVTRE